MNILTYTLTHMQILFFITFSNKKGKMHLSFTDLNISEKYIPKAEPNISFKRKTEHRITIPSQSLFRQS